ncbi:enediyne polyketide synthase [Haloechinothrix alba]|uniref:Enediyne polyketide synthase n=1 Tax=Haloechinothrix alba TaxID=664784 RepID=A0A238V3A9_9PSEU|nr:type I polyketide synthase [Haloechinothrix alba]SNR28554.1 enediyne polyketide synthase [Haloechinothrix alba]
MSTNRIAIVGMACRYPDATTPEELWQTVLGKRRAFRRIPERRLPAAYRAEPGEPDHTYASHAAVLRDWTFDRARFGVPGPLYRAADQTHWLALETAAAALADAGFAGGDGIDRSTAGVVLGNSLAGEFSRAGMLRLRWPFLADAAATALQEAGASTDLSHDVLRRLEGLVKQPFPEPGDETLAGSLANTIAGRICNYFDFNGTGYTVDGACSSSLLAVTTASRALASGECDFVLAGGVDMSLDPLELVGFSRLGALAGSDMRVYDARPTGFLPGEGCGVIALMRAEDAERRGLRSYAHIVGWASSSDGAGGLTRPEHGGQVLALRRAYHSAGLQPCQAQLIEGHGTGTAIGDAVELEALISARGRTASPAAIGSVKANIGHTKAAAGVAGLIKAAMATHNRVLPPITGCERPVDLLRDGSGNDVPLRILDAPEPWPEETPRAGVSSMGFGGINVHIVLEGTGPAPRVLPTVARRWSDRAGPHEIVCLGADGLGELADRLTRLARSARDLSTAEVTDIAATAWHERRGSRPWRAALVARTPDELAAAADAAAAATDGWDGSPRFDRNAGYALGSAGPARVGLLFPGQAAPVRWTLPWWARHLDVPDPPAELVERQVSADTEIAQPAILRQSLAALAWLGELGCTGVAATGHSLGEITALHWAGSCTAAQALELARVRGRLMARLGAGDTTMAGVSATADRVEELIRDTGAVISAYNAAERMVVSGTVADIDRIVERAADAGVPASRLAVSHGFHSTAMLPVARSMRDALADVPLDRPGAPVVSTITGRPSEASPDELRERLVAQLTSPVRFAEAVTHLADRCDLLVEAGPGTALAGLAESNTAVPAVSMDCGGADERHAFVTALLAACAGADLEPWFSDRPYRPLDIEAVPEFVASPCENREGWADAAEVRGAEVRGAEPDTRGTERVAAEEPAPTCEDARAALTRHLATLLELPTDAVSPSSSLLRDLHMTSLQVVEAVATVARAQGKQPPGAPLSLGDATFAEAAAVIEDLPETHPAGEEGAPGVPGVRGWVRQFSSPWVPFTAPQHERTESPAVRWHVHAPAGHWSHELAGGGDTQADGFAVALPAETTRTEIAELLGEIGGRDPAHLLVVHDGHPAAAGLARSVASELDRCRVTVLAVPDLYRRIPPDELTGIHGERYLELRECDGGQLERRTAVARPVAGAEAATVELDGVCLVTGGVRGITAYTAAGLAEHTGCTPVFLGRSPQDDPEVTDALRDLRGRVPAHYISCDVTDESSVAAMVTTARGYGPIRGLVHGAGLNEPRTLGDVTPESFERTLRPKVEGLRVLLDALGDDLRLLVGFGSIIGRQGLAGQAEYCIANDWMRNEIEDWARAHPGCRAHHVEWSVWSGMGMGVRLGVLDNLRGQGVEPIGPEQGVRVLLDLFADAAAPTTVLVTSRFPATATLRVEGPAPPTLRFAEYARAHVPGVEAVTESELSLGDDPYLDDHRIDGVPVLPAVVAMEAMAQSAVLVSGTRPAWSMTDLEFHSPLTLSDSGRRAVQVAALAERHGIDTAVRDDSDGFGSDRFTGTVSDAPDPPAHVARAEPPEDPERQEHELYGGVLFHGGRFRRLLRYDALSAFRVSAWIRAGQRQRWFSEFHGNELLLGDPAAHDATLHALLACVPHRRALPVGVDRVTIRRLPEGPLRVTAVERSHTATDYVFDVDLADPDGAVVARWQGLRLRAVTSPAYQEELPERLVGPWLTRRLIECDIADGVELVTVPGTRQDGAAAAERITGAQAGHDTAGGLLVDGHHASTSHTSGRLLLALAPGPVGVGWDALPDTLPTNRPALSGTGDPRTAEALCEKLGEEPALTMTRVSTAREALDELGSERDTALRVDEVTEDGIAVLRGGGVQVATAKVRAREPGSLAVVSVALPYRR